jgi:hypothetical protein
MGNSCTKEFQIKSSTIALDNIEKEKVLTRKTTLSVNSYGLTLIDISKVIMKFTQGRHQK